MYSLTLGTTWWRWMNSPVIVQKSLLASSSPRVESSWSWVGESNSSDVLWRISCSSPRSGSSRVKADVLRRCSHPQICTVPSPNGKMKLPLLSGANTSFALSLLAWSSDASISSNSSMSATIMSLLSRFSLRRMHNRENILGKTFALNWSSLDWLLQTALLVR